MPTSILEVSGVGPATVTLLAEHGIHSVEDLAGIKVAALTAVQGFSETRARKVIDAAKTLLLGTAVVKTDQPKKQTKKKMVAKPSDKQKAAKLKAKQEKVSEEESTKLQKKKKGSKDEKKQKSKKKKKNKAEKSSKPAKKTKDKKSGKKK